MVTVLELAKSHLLNVEREISGLHEQKKQLDAQIEKLTGYLNDGKQVVAAAEADRPVSNDGAPTVFNPQIHSNQ